MVNTGHKGMQGNKKVGRLWKASSVVIPSIPGKYLSGLITDGEEGQVTLSGRFVAKGEKSWYQPKDVLLLLIYQITACAGEMEGVRRQTLRFPHGLR